MTLVFYLLVITGIIICAPFIVLTHELGHALAYIIFTKPDNIDILIGSSSPQKNTFSFRIKHLKIQVTPNFPFKCAGYCLSNKVEYNYIKYILILLSGCITTLLFALSVLLLSLYFDVHGAIKLLCVIMLCYSVYVGYHNLIAKRSKIGSTDGERIAFALNLGKAFSHYLKGVANYDDENHEVSLTYMQQAYNIKPNNTEIQRWYIYTLIANERLQEAENMIKNFAKQRSLKWYDMDVIASVYHKSGKKNEAVAYYKKSLQILPNNVDSILSLSYLQTELGLYEEAVDNLQKIFGINQDYPFISGYLGYCKILQGELKEGKNLIELSLKTDGENAYLYKGLGIYYLKINDITEADNLFKRAIELDASIDIDQYQKNEAPNSID
ncbi:hypothetical protein [Mucilaginibacter defluvii]|uniref:Tetratricopeptide repeat protein n=1 Tax=Mucilaginibacter defluvii TaxID=1196019 RepID=A0ABP9FT87_9SPHI